MMAAGVGTAARPGTPAPFATTRAIRSSRRHEAPFRHPAPVQLKSTIVQVKVQVENPTNPGQSNTIQVDHFFCDWHRPLPCLRPPRSHAFVTAARWHALARRHNSPPPVPSSLHAPRPGTALARVRHVARHGHGTARESALDPFGCQDLTRLSRVARLIFTHSAPRNFRT